jgi:putative methanogenesis marker protein 6
VQISRYFAIAPGSGLSPQELVQWLLEHSPPEITIKETCFGAIADGPEEELKELAEKAREEFGPHVFSKVRGYPAGDERVCRRTRGGGPRPGFPQLQREVELLDLIAEGLRAVERGEKIEAKERRPVPAERIRELAEEEPG